MIKAHQLAREILAGHALATLPDSTAERRKVLYAVLGVLPIGHASRPEVKHLIVLLDEFERQQLQLALSFEKAAATATTKTRRAA